MQTYDWVILQVNVDVFKYKLGEHYPMIRLHVGYMQSSFGGTLKSISINKRMEDHEKTSLQVGAKKSASLEYSSPWFIKLKVNGILILDFLVDLIQWKEKGSLRVKLRLMLDHDMIRSLNWLF